MILGLTRAENEVLDLICQGKTNKEIARERHTSYGTVKHHVHNILGKLGAKNRCVAMWMVHQGIVDIKQVKNYKHVR